MVMFTCRPRSKLSTWAIKLWRLADLCPPSRSSKGCVAMVIFLPAKSSELAQLPAPIGENLD